MEDSCLIFSLTQHSQSHSFTNNTKAVGKQLSSWSGLVAPTTDLSRRGMTRKSRQATGKPTTGSDSRTAPGTGTPLGFSWRKAFEISAADSNAHVSPNVLLGLLRTAFRMTCCLYQQCCNLSRIFFWERKRGGFAREPNTTWLSGTYWLS